MKQKSSLHKTFYSKFTHTNEEFHNHRYFTEQRVYSQDINTLGKEYVDLPQPFGVNNTYLYLRKLNKDKLPDIITNPQLRRESKFIPKPSNQSLIGTKTQDINLRHQNSNSPFFSPPKLSYRKFPKHKNIETNQTNNKVFIKFMLYDRFRMQQNKEMVFVQMDIMKYLIGCFLSSPLKLETMSIDEYQFLEEFIPRALENRRSEKKNTEYISRSFLGIDQMNHYKDLILRVQNLKELNKNKEIIALLDYFILPSFEVMNYQMDLLLSDINKENQIKFKNQYSFYQYLYDPQNGKQILNLFEIGSKQKIIVASQEQLNHDQFMQIQLSLSSQNKFNARIKRQELFRSRITRNMQESTKYDPVSKSLQNDTCSKINEIFQKRRKLMNLKSKDKEKSLLKSRKKPFIDRAKLIHQIDLFE